MDRIVAAMPVGSPNLTSQKAFYVAISRARDHAEPVTDGVRKLSDQLERAAGERISTLDGVAKEAVHETEFDLERAEDRCRSHESHGSRARSRAPAGGVKESRNEVHGDGVKLVAMSG